MKVQVEVSIYPLKVKSLSEHIDTFCRILKSYGLKVQTRSMSTFTTGESQVIFKALAEAFEKLAEEYYTVMDVKVSNACPYNGRE